MKDLREIFLHAKKLKLYRLNGFRRRSAPRR